MFKKTKNFFIILMLMFIPIDVLACPHADRDGNLHLQTYNADYTIVSMIYPRLDYLYSKDVYMDVEGVNLVLYEDDVLKEDFGFALYQDLTSYYTYYWIIDTDVTFGSLEENNDVKIDVEGIETITVEGEGYYLNVSLPNSYNEGIGFLSEDTYQIYYNALVSNESKNENYTKLISSYDINLLSEIYDLSANFMHTKKEGYFYNTEYTDIEVFMDEIEFNIYSENYSENAIIINLNEIYTDAFIETEYIDNHYTFTADKSGIYVVADFIDITLEDGYILEEELSEESNNLDDSEDVVVYESNNDNNEINNNYIYIVCAIVSIIIVIGTVIILNKKEEI